MALKYETQVVVDRFDLEKSLLKDCGIKTNIIPLFWPDGIENDSYQDLWYDDDSTDPLQQKVYKYLRSLNLPTDDHIVLRTWW